MECGDTAVECGDVVVVECGDAVVVEWWGRGGGMWGRGGGGMVVTGEGVRKPGPFTARGCPEGPWSVGFAS